MSSKKLSSGAKAFVPYSLLNSGAQPWTPPTTSSSPPKSEGKKVTNETSSKAPTKKETTTTEASDAQATPKVAPVPTPKPKPSVWGKKTANLVLSAPKPNQQAAQQEQQQQQSHNNKRKSNKGGGASGQQQWRNQKNEGGGNWRNQKKSDREEVGGGRGGRGRHHKNNDDSASNDGWSRGKSLPLELLKPNEGKDDHEKGVARIVAEELSSLRLSFVAAPLSWESQTSGDGDDGDDGDDKPLVGPPDECRWISDTRLQEIDSMTNAKRLGGDVSFRKKKKQENDTAPPLEECKPLEVNEGTRWKAGVFNKDKKVDDENADSNDVVFKNSLLILNKLSLTKFEKLSDAFIATGIGRNEECLAGAIELVVTKAQDEPHFAAMYAALCLKLSRTPMDFEPEGKMKRFKKMLLSECQKEFEQDTETKTAKAIEGVEDEDEKRNKAGLVKKHYLGHMRFIGELYKGDLINIKIMLMCLPQLLESTTDKEGDTGIDEEKVECFAKLMTVIGSDLQQQSLNLKGIGKTDAFEKLSNCWKTVEAMAGKRKAEGPKISNRIKFMMQDLIEMKDNGWVQRREEESAKTIAQIHKEAAKEARRGSSSSNLHRSASSSNIRRQSSSNDVRNIGRSSKPSVDSEGFTQISRTGGMGRSQSMTNIVKRNDSRSNLQKAEKSKVSSGGSFAAFNSKSKATSSPKRDFQRKQSQEALPNVDEKTAHKEVHLPSDECGKKMKNYLKEYFVGGDTDDIVLSIHELIGAGSEGSTDRGSKVIESSVLMLLEMKAENVDMFLTVITRCITEKKIDSRSIISGLNDPLEFLSDIAIDAPLATAHLVTIVSKFIELGTIKFDFLLDAPQHFRLDSGAARFGCKVLHKIGGDSISSQENIDTIEKLMTAAEKEMFPAGAKDMLC